MPRVRREQPPYKLGLRFLAEAPDGLSAVELAALVGIAKRNMLEYIKIWKEEDGLIRIRDWRSQEGPGDPTPVYTLKDFPDQKDKRKPTPMTGAQKQKRYREKYGPLIRARQRQKRTGNPKIFKMLLDKGSKR